VIKLDIRVVFELFCMYDHTTDSTSVPAGCGSTWKRSDFSEEEIMKVIKKLTYYKGLGKSGEWSVQQSAK
jgi:hypothetical protein